MKNVSRILKLLQIKPIVAGALFDGGYSIFAHSFSGNAVAIEISRIQHALYRKINATN